MYALALKKLLPVDQPGGGQGWIGEHVEEPEAEEGEDVL